MTNQKTHNPVLNVPVTILAMMAVFAIIHAVRVYGLDRSTDLDVLLQFSFIPARYVNQQLIEYSNMALYWSPLTYSVLHADWTHLFVNSLWLLVFGAVVARRFNALYFIIFCVFGSLGGALAHYVSHPESFVPTIGASAVVSACVGASTRFAFQAGMGLSPLDDIRPRLSLFETFRNRQTFAFIGIWFLVNYLSGAGFVDVSGEGGQIAWEAHVGGFLVGLLMFPLFDPIKSSRSNGPGLFR